MRCETLTSEMISQCLFRIVSNAQTNNKKFGFVNRLSATSNVAEIEVENGSRESEHFSIIYVFMWCVGKHLLRNCLRSTPRRKCRFTSSCNPRRVHLNCLPTSRETKQVFVACFVYRRDSEWGMMLTIRHGKVNVCM